MVAKYDELMGESVETILKSPRLTLNLLKLASTCLLSGGQPRGCEKAIRNYYTKLKSEAMRKKIVGLSTKTCKMKPGVFFIAKAQKHYSDANMDDDTARAFLEKGYLKPEMFIKLPEEPTNTVKMVDDAGEPVPVQTTAPKPRKRKKPSKK